MNAGAKSSSKPSFTKKKKPKTTYLQKPKLLYIGDSIAHNVNFNRLEGKTTSRIRTRKAYSSVMDTKAKYPMKNVTDVTKATLFEVPEDDKFSHLVIAASSVDITNINSSNITVDENIEIFKQKDYISCQNTLTVAENAIKTHPELKKVVLIEHATRFEMDDVDPTGLKPELAKYSNRTLSQLVQNSSLKNRIMIGKHNIGADQPGALYRDERTGRYDGLHMYARKGYHVYTESVLHILQSCLNQNSRDSSSCFGMRETP